MKGFTDEPTSETQKSESWITTAWWAWKHTRDYHTSWIVNRESWIVIELTLYCTSESRLCAQLRWISMQNRIHDWQSRVHRTPRTIRDWYSQFTIRDWFIDCSVPWWFIVGLWVCGSGRLGLTWSLHLSSYTMYCRFAILSTRIAQTNTTRFQLSKRNQESWLVSRDCASLSIA